MYIFTRGAIVCVSACALCDCSLINKFDEVKIRDQAIGDAADVSSEQELCSGVAMGSSDCEQCTAGACCPALQTCVWNPDCANLLACVQACSASDGGDTCNTKCLDAHPGSVPTLESLVVCQQANCKTACPANSENDAGPDSTAEADDAADDTSDAGNEKADENVADGGSDAEDEETGGDSADGGSDANDDDAGNDAATESSDDVVDEQNPAE